MQNFQTEGSALMTKVKNSLSIKNLVRYIVEGITVAIAAYVIPNRRTNLKEVGVISLIASLTLFILDLFSNDVAAGTRFGAGAGIGYNLVSSAPTLPFM